MSSCIFDAILGSKTIAQCDSASFQANIEVTPLRNSGAIDPVAHYITGGAPKGMWTTTDLATLLGSGGVLPAAGLSIAAASNIDLPWSRRLAGSTRAGSTSHTRIRGATGGMAVLSRIQASQGQPFASADFEVGFLSSDGLTAPCSIAVDQSLSSQTAVNVFRLGPAYGTKSGGASTQGKGVVGVTVNPNVELLFEKFDGAIRPINAYIKERNPTIEVQFLDEEDLDFWCDLYNQLTAFTVYLQKMTAGGTVVAGATSEHIALSFADAVVSCEGISGSGTDTALPTMRITGESLSVSVASALP